MGTSGVMNEPGSARPPVRPETRRVRPRAAHRLRVSRLLARLAGVNAQPPSVDVDERGLSRLLEANALIERSENRAIQITGFAGFTLPLVGGLLPDGFEQLTGLPRTVALAALIAALVCLGLSIFVGLRVIVTAKRVALTPDALGQLLDRGLERDDYVAAYRERIGDAKQARGQVLGAAVIYGTGLFLTVVCLAIISSSL